MAKLADLLNGFEGDASKVEQFIYAKAKELGVNLLLDDGRNESYVHKAKYEAEVQKNKDLNDTIAAHKESLEKLEKLTKNDDKSQSVIKDLQTKNENLKTQVRQTSIKSSLAEKAVKLNSVAPVDDLLALINTKDLVVNSDTGEVIGLDEALSSLKSNKPYLFKAANPDPNGDGNKDPNSNAGAGNGGAGTGDPGKANSSIVLGGKQFKAGEFGKTLGSQVATQQTAATTTNFFK